LIKLAIKWKFLYYLIIKEFNMSQEYLIAIVVVAVVIVIIVLYAIAKKKNVRIWIKRKDTGAGISVTEEKETEQKPSEGAGNISDVEILNHGTIQDSNNVNIHVGHSTKNNKNSLS